MQIEKLNPETTPEMMKQGRYRLIASGRSC